MHIKRGMTHRSSTTPSQHALGRWEVVELSRRRVRSTCHCSLQKNVVYEDRLGDVDVFRVDLRGYSEALQRTAELLPAPDAFTSAHWSIAGALRRRNCGALLWNYDANGVKMATLAV